MLDSYEITFWPDFNDLYFPVFFSRLWLLLPIALMIIGEMKLNARLCETTMMDSLL